MSRTEKTVFLSYRRTNLPWALNIFHNLTAHGYDVFFDYESLSSGDFEKNILSNIRARAHFVVVLTPSALERCDNPDDWLRREIETALDEKRNIVPLFLEGFSFISPSISNQLIGKLENLKNYNGLNIPADYFSEAMERLRNRHLNIPIDAVIHPVSSTVQKEVEKQKTSANEATEIKKIELMAQEWFEKSNKYFLENNYNEAIRCATEAIRLNPDFAEGYNRRASAKNKKEDYDGAIRDCNEAIRLKPDFPNSYVSRSFAYTSKGEYEKAIKDCVEAIRLKPDYAEAYVNRSFIFAHKKDYQKVILDSTEAIRLKPNISESYLNRSAAFLNIGEYDKAIKDSTEAIRLTPNDPLPYRNRGIAWENKKDYYSALADYETSLKLGDKYPNLPKMIENVREKIK